MIKEYNNDINEIGFTHLQLYIINNIGNWESIKQYILRYKNDDYHQTLIRKINNNHHNALDIAILCDAPEEFLKFLLQNINILDDKTKELFNSIKQENLSILSLSIKYNYNFITNSILTKLDDDKCEELILKQDIKGNCALHYAALKESSHMLEIILFHLYKSDRIYDYTKNLKNNDNQSPYDLYQDSSIIQHS